MERYSSYKTTSIQWLKEIPSHWECVRIKNILKESQQTTIDGKEEQLSVTQSFGIIRSIDAKISNPPSSTLGWKIVKRNDIVFNKYKAHSGVFFASQYDGIVTFNYSVYNCFNNCNPKYYELLFHTDSCIGEFRKLMRGVGESISPLYTAQLYTVRIPLPPLDEQEKIVSYLEDKTSKIDAYVADKEKEIELLQELKQKTIADAVTKGLNPDAKMKDYSSLISSSCPEHWKIVRNKSFLSLTGEKVGKKASEFVLLSLTTKGVIVRDIESGKGKFPKDFDTYQIVKPNELVFCLFDIDETPRTVGLVETEGMLTGAYTAFKVHTELANPEYIYNYYLCVDNIKALKPYYSGLRKTVRADKFQQIYMPLPPLNEQQAIVAYIEEKCQKIDKLTSELQSEIDYLKEYKQRLIADVVTGQVNVQNL